MATDFHTGDAETTAVDCRLRAYNVDARRLLDRAISIDAGCLRQKRHRNYVRG